jgi:hypothetical protein
MRSGKHQFVGDFSVDPDIYAAADLMRDGRALAVDNGTVFALWGDGAKSAFIDEVDRAKGRDPNRPYGLSLCWADFLSLVDADRVHPSILPLVAEPDEFRDRLGAITFVKAPLDSKRAEERGLPRRLLSGPEHAPIGQDWSPEGKANIAFLLELAGLECAAVTSLNRSVVEPEIIGLDKALQFARKHDLPIIGDSLARREAKGSYPIIDIHKSDPVTGAERRAIHVVRSRAKGIGSALLSRLLVGVPLTTASADALPGIDPPELKGLSGPELREGLLHYLGWAAVHTD